LYFVREILIKKNKLNNDKIKKLEGIKCWKWSEKKYDSRESFDKRYDKLKKFVDKYKKIPSEKSLNKLEKSLGTFCCCKRRNYKNNKLDSDKIQKLEQIPGWYWKKNIFDEKYIKLIKFVHEHKKLPSVYSSNKIEKMLGIFCSHRRQEYKQNKLDKNRIFKLQQINGWYWGTTKK